MSQYNEVGLLQTQHRSSGRANVNRLNQFRMDKFQNATGIPMHESLDSGTDRVLAMYDSTFPKYSGLVNLIGGRRLKDIHRNDEF